MTPFEEDLKKALARREPPDGFTERVLRKTRERQTKTTYRNPLKWLARVHVRPFIPALAALLLITIGVVFQQHQRAVRGEEAKEKLLLAMRIAGTKLHDAQEHVIQLQGTEVK